jgi:hypothetical protein
MLLYIASATVLGVLLLVAGCLRPQLCGGKFEVYELEDYIRPGENVVHLTEKDFAELPELGAVMRGDKRTIATCKTSDNILGHCIGGSNFQCGDQMTLLKYLDRTENAIMNLKLKKFLEYDGKYYFMEITQAS